MKIIFKDDTFSGSTENSFSKFIIDDYCTVEELVRYRIYEEVEDYNRKLPEYFRGLIQPTDSEVVLNGSYKMIEKRRLDPEKQYYLALDAYMKNKFFILINEAQVESLEQKIKIRDNMEIIFIKLTQLVGG